MDDDASHRSRGRRGWTAALAVLVVCGTQAGTADPGGWEVIARKDGIVVSRRPVEGRAFPELRAVGEVPGTPQEVLAILLDVPAHVAWFPDCMESRTVRELDGWRSIIYSRNDAPWPVSDREVVVENSVNWSGAPSRLVVNFHSVAAPEVPKGKGTVRMQKATGSYTIENKGDGRSIVRYEVDADPGGSLPAWLVTEQSTRNPLGAIVGLRERLVETRGRYRDAITRFPR